MIKWGFRSLHSTALALIDCSTNWRLNIGKGVNNLTVFLEIKKAFDTIDHSILLEKHRYYGIMGGEFDFSGHTSKTASSAAMSMASYHVLNKLYMEFPRVPFWSLCFLFFIRTIYHVVLRMATSLCTLTILVLWNSDM